MASKKRRSYSGTPAQHRVEAGIDAGNMRKAQRAFNKELKYGRCVEALSAFARAVRAQASYHAEAAYTRRGGGGPTSRRVMRSMELRFVEKCVL